jgi:tetratricopeptide (TPR) repeat protein
MKMTKKTSTGLDKRLGGPIEYALMRSSVSIASSFVLFLVVIVLISATVMRNRVYQDTVSVWKSIVDSSPNKRRPHENYGQALSSVGRLEEALAEFKTVLALEDDGSVPMRDVYREIGVVYFRLGRFDEAINAWQHGLQYVPTDSGLLNNLAIAFMKQKRMDEAVASASAAARYNPLMPEPMNTLGELFLAKGDPRKAAESFKRYLYLRPEDARGYWNTALALRQTGDFQEALRYAQEFLARERDPRFRAAAGGLVQDLQKRVRN